MSIPAADPNRPEAVIRLTGPNARFCAAQNFLNGARRADQENLSSKPFITHVAARRGVLEGVTASDHR